MWLEIICGLIIYQLYRLFFYGSSNALDVKTSDFNAIFSVANRLEKICGGKAYVGLNIPDADTGGRSHRKECLPDPVAEVKKRVSVLESYLEQRGFALPEGYFSYKVIIPNPNFREIYRNFPPEVITYDQWVQLEPEPKSMMFGWVKGAFHGGKKAMQDSFHQQLNFILGTAPMWDRLELKGSKYILGEFLEFKGKEEDTQALRHIKRSKVGHITIQKTSMLGLARSRLQVVYYPRDYRSEGTSTLDWREVEARSSTEVLFHPSNSNKVRKYKLSSIISMSLSA
ncbi:cinnamoyl-CoA reductase 1-like isoform X1 [Hibiscus syriacus]|uniref:Cinnamoyl-CoA reductase 1-like isoform X1 n=1 Tax=Hibiscus syriacus TaxID=106335 RepID=A0A6A3B7B3_HIBSY|nr:cinnamoyl-CoA reductase 1-like isoform X1 [Hibiscus syriacus]